VVANFEKTISLILSSKRIVGLVKYQKLFGEICKLSNNAENAFSTDDFWLQFGGLVWNIGALCIKNNSKFLLNNHLTIIFKVWGQSCNSTLSKQFYSRCPYFVSIKMYLIKSLAANLLYL
jgi:hypothetical protein